MEPGLLACGMRRRVVRPVGAVGLAVAITACDAEGGGRALAVVDSAGVRIALAPDTTRVFATVEPEPLVSIGGPEASGPEQFFRVQGVRLDGRNRIWVADGQSGEVRIYHPDGSHWKSGGGRGDGPGEFRSVRLLGAFRADSVAFGDRSNDRITIFDPEGELARTVRLGTPDDAVPLPHRVFADGSVLAQVPRILESSSLRPGQILGDTARLVRAEPGGAPVFLAEAGGPLWLWTGRTQVPIPFTANPGLAVVGESLHLVSGPAFRIRVFSAGRLAEIYGVDRPERPVREEDLAGYRSMTEQHVDEEQRPDFLAALEHDARPTVLPGYARLLVDERGRVWAQWYAPDVRWDVFGPDRRYLGRVEAPEGLLIQSVRGSRLAGVWRDELTTEHVRVYGFSPS